MRYESAQLMLQEAASAEHTAALQKELEQLHTSAGHMKVHLEAAQQSQLDAQVPGCFVDACNVLSFHHDLLLFVDVCFALFCFVLFVDILCAALHLTVCPYCWLFTHSYSTSFPGACLLCLCLQLFVLLSRE